MGKGDKKTRKGKIFKGTYGVRRKRKPRKNSSPIDNEQKNSNVNSEKKLSSKNSKSIEDKQVKFTLKREKVNKVIPKEKTGPQKQNSPTDSYDKGVEAEKFVNELASNAYLKYWCYLNPKDEDGDKKEICDLLIVFFETVIIISVKNYNTKGDYDKYKRKVVDKSTNQLSGAERKLFGSNRNIRIKHTDRGDFIFNASDYNHVYRITVSVGEQFEKYEFIDGNKEKGTVNILNKEVFEVITNELDTIKDLVEYLNTREQLFTHNIGNETHCSEKDLLAYYLMNKREFPEECYNGNYEEWSKSCIGKWEVYLSSRSVLLKKLADEKSYFIDRLIKTDVLPLPNGEEMARELMTLSRFERRYIANNLYEMVERYQGTVNDFSRRHHINDNGTLFLYVFYPPLANSKQVDEILGQAAELYGYKFKPKRVLYLAVTENMRQWKFGLTNFGECEFENLPQGQIKFYEDEIASRGWFSNMKMTVVESKEYPDEQ